MNNVNTHGHAYAETASIQITSACCHVAMFGVALEGVTIYRGAQINLIISNHHCIQNWGWGKKLEGLRPGHSWEVCREGGGGGGGGRGDTAVGIIADCSWCYTTIVMTIGWIVGLISATIQIFIPAY